MSDNMFSFAVEPEAQMQIEPETEQNEFFTDFSKPVDDSFEKPKEPEEVVDSYFDDEPVTVPKAIKEAKKIAANQIVNIVSSGLDALLQMYTGVNEFGRYKPPAENLKEIEGIVVEMLPDRTPEMPKWLFLAIALFAAYSPIITTVKRDKEKKNNKEKTNYFED